MFFSSTKRTDRTKGLNSVKLSRKKIGFKPFKMLETNSKIK